MTALLTELRHNPLLWLLVFVPAVFVAQAFDQDAHTHLFVLSVLAIVPLAALLSHATESIATRTHRELFASAAYHEDSKRGGRLAPPCACWPWSPCYSRSSASCSSEDSESSGQAYSPGEERVLLTPCVATAKWLGKDPAKIRRAASCKTLSGSHYFDADRDWPRATQSFASV